METALRSLARHVRMGRPVLKILIAAALSTLLMTRQAGAQTFFFNAGISSSWGHKNIILCTLTCAPGWASSHKNWVTPTVGVAVVAQPIAALQLETGGSWVAKGWSVTTPNMRRLYLEVPLLAHFGYWPRDVGIGIGATGGVAMDAFLPTLGESDVAWIGGVRLLAVLPSGPQFSLGIRYTRGLTDVSRVLQNRSWTYVIGFAPGEE